MENLPHGSEFVAISGKGVVIAYAGGKPVWDDEARQYSIDWEGGGKGCHTMTAVCCLNLALDAEQAKASLMAVPSIQCRPKPDEKYEE